MHTIDIFHSRIKPKRNETERGQRRLSFAGKEKGARDEIYLRFLRSERADGKLREADEDEGKGLIIRLMYEAKVNSWWISYFILFRFLQFFIKWGSTTKSLSLCIRNEFRHETGHGGEGAYRDKTDVCWLR